ncbi:hypothetical protein MUK42_02248 [Musa troglodytarum]|uniref:Uncharacterized protein n=1 Tax=Musa troglodytarum TaxID=320322 RepID=A0A9E7K2Y7_9LILI|nr:hypothetical protein MUK42_02248 [Musa troglodytarum]
MAEEIGKRIHRWKRRIEARIRLEPSSIKSPIAGLRRDHRRVLYAVKYYRKRKLTPCGKVSLTIAALIPKS